MSMSIGNNYSSLFSSMNGSYNAASDMQSVIAQRSQIQNGSYGKLMKAYVKKVGNTAALNAYRSTGTTVNSATDVSGASSSSTSSTSATSTSNASKYASYKSNFLDSHLSSIGKTQVSRATASGKSYLDSYLKEQTGSATEKTGVQRAIEAAEKATGIKNPFAVGGATETTGTETTAATATATAADKYASMQSSWLDDHLKSYDQNAEVQTAANSSVAIDTTA